MYDNILIGYDESDYSQAAVKEIAAWVNRHGGEASLIHGVYSDNEEFGIKPDMLKVRLKEGEDVCKRAKDYAADFGITMNTVVQEGDPPDVIVDTAVTNKADLIALGTYGRKGLQRVIIGSVTAKVIAEAPCDVLIVKRPCCHCTGKYRKILVAYDGSPSSKKALKAACELAVSDGGDVTALYVIPQYQEMINFLKTKGINKILANEAKEILEQAAVIGREAGVNVDIQLEEGHPAEQLVNAANKNQSDVVIMGSYGWHGIDKSIIGSTAERVIMTTERPILVVK